MASDTRWDPIQLLKQPAQRLSYSVHSASGYHASFLPAHITADKPNDDNSRWTAPSPEDRRMQARKAALVGTADSASSSNKSAAGKERRRAPEWITVELNHIALVKTIGFGKTTKPHPCNLAEFTLWGGLSPDPLAMEPLLEGSLKNDASTETFELPIQIGELESASTTPLPVKFLRIDCHVAANANYSISIWHLFLEGYSPLPTTLSSLDSHLPSAAALVSLYESHRHQHTTRLILAHLRRSGPMYLPTFRTLLSTLSLDRDRSGETSSEPPPRLEHPLLAALHESLVLRGDWDRSEAVLDEILATGLLDEWDGAAGGTKGRTVAKWDRIGPAEEDLGAQGPGGSTAWPCGRGGHAMVRVGRRVLLYGGWDGKRELGDMWEFDLPLHASDSGSGKWRCLDVGTTSTEKNGVKSAPTTTMEKPGPRSCHQMVVDERDGWVYVLGARRDELESEEEDGDGEDDFGVRDRSASVGENGGATTGGGGGMDIDETGAPRGRDGAISAATAARDERWKSDFWRYKAAGPERGKWELLSEDTRRDGGPALLFDHQMVIHTATSRLFVFGGKNQPFMAGSIGGALTGTRNPDPAASLYSDATRSRYSGMWCYHLDSRKWTHLFGDPLSPTATPPGPSANAGSSDRLLSRAGHALILDSDPLHPTLYVYSGQRNEQYLQDLWAIRLASANAAPTEDERGRDPSRRMEPTAEDDSTLWRQGTVLDFPFPASSSTSAAAINRSLVDLSALPASPEASPSRQSGRGSGHVPTILQICRLWPSTTGQPATSSVPVPPASFTPRVTLDPTTQNWTLLTGLIRSVPSMGTSSDMAEGCLRGVWRRRTPRKLRSVDLGWERIEEEWGSLAAGSSQPETSAQGNAGQSLPPPRFATQVVYDPLLKDHYLFGGHPEVQTGEAVDWRQSDMWRLRVIDPTPQEAHRKAKFLLRKQRFVELCRTAPTLLALQYLQNDLASVVDHSSPTESSSFRACMTALMSAPARMNIDIPLDGSQELPSPGGSEADGGDRLDTALYRERHSLFEEVSRLVPKSERQPDENLEDTSRLLRVWQMTGTRV
ncbi:hypothetical protein JCM10908_002064 [Rhodotorula pacifica]|uniref:uncharacterized protein n=1 Tax=Rhodotorula pacifica TaxID=1495444 RepID=UPI00317D2E5B